MVCAATTMPSEPDCADQDHDLVALAIAAERAEALCNLWGRGEPKLEALLADGTGVLPAPAQPEARLVDVEPGDLLAVLVVVDHALDSVSDP